MGVFQSPRFSCKSRQMMRHIRRATMSTAVFGFFAACPVLLVERAKVRRATIAHPTRFDKAQRSHLLQKGRSGRAWFATAGVGGRATPAYAQKFFPALEKRSIASTSHSDHRGQSRADPGHAQQMLMIASFQTPAAIRFSCASFAEQSNRARRAVSRKSVAFRFRQFQATQKTKARTPKISLHCGNSSSRCRSKSAWMQIAQHRAQPRPVKSLPQQIFARPRFSPRHVRACHQVPPQQRP